jgi:hypothetical protein
MEDSLAGGPLNVVEEIRTGQQFLIKLQLTRRTGTPPGNLKYPTMRVDRREAINTAGEPRADAEPLTLQVIVHLARSGQIRKGACAKCCHKVCNLGSQCSFYWELAFNLDLSLKDLHHSRYP